MRVFLVKTFLLFLGLTFPFLNLFSQEIIPVRTIAHLSSTVSDGKNSLEEIAQIAKDNNIGAVIFTDRDIMRWEYGLPGLRNIIKKHVEDNSIFTYGIDKYLLRIDNLRKKFPDIVFVSGVESEPFYYWQGSLLKNNFKLYNTQKHILAIGLDKVDDYKKLPVVSNKKGLRTGLDFPKLLFLLALLFGIWCFRVKEYEYEDDVGNYIFAYSKKWHVFGLVVIIVSLVLVANSWPFKNEKFDQYSGDLGIKPYQTYIDYIDNKGGLTFWAHPQATYLSKRNNITIETNPYQGSLYQSKDYTGFEIFPEGYSKVGTVGGIWDDILTEYCKGKRDKPIWAISGLAFDAGINGSLKERIDNFNTIVFVAKKDITTEGLLTALKEGRVYAVAGKNNLEFSLNEFSVSDGLTNKKAIVAQTIKASSPVLRIKGSFKYNQQKVNVNIIKNGKIEKTVNGIMTPFDIIHQDKPFQSKGYYRVEIKGQGLHLITNPIFVE